MYLWLPWKTKLYCLLSTQKISESVYFENVVSRFFFPVYDLFFLVSVFPYHIKLVFPTLILKFSLATKLCFSVSKVSYAGASFQMLMVAGEAETLWHWEKKARKFEYLIFVVWLNGKQLCKNYPPTPNLLFLASDDKWHLHAWFTSFLCIESSRLNFNHASLFCTIITHVLKHSELQTEMLYPPAVWRGDRNDWVTLGAVLWHHTAVPCCLHCQHFYR